MVDRQGGFLKVGAWQVSVTGSSGGGATKEKKIDTETACEGSITSQALVSGCS